MNEQCYSSRLACLGRFEIPRQARNDNIEDFFVLSNLTVAINPYGVNFVDVLNTYNNSTLKSISGSKLKPV